MKKFKMVLACAMTGVMLLSVSGCSSVPLIDDEDVFIDALDSVAGIDEDDCIVYDDGDEVDGSDTEYELYYYDKVSYVYIRFEDAEDAHDYFEDMYDDVSDLKDDDEFEGSSKLMLTDSQGYVLLDGDIDCDDSSDYSDGHYYGGIYLRDNVVISIYTDSSGKSKKADVDDFVKTLKLPRI